MYLFNLILKAITFGTLLIGACALYIAIRNNSRQLAAQIFLAYSSRVREIRSAAADDFNRPEAILEATYLIFEFHSLRRRGYAPKPIWQIWEADMTDLLNRPSFLHLWPTIRHRFENHPHFLAWVAERHGARASKNANRNH
ncbi:MAG: hypothetical protein JO056_13470 [Alphaproteobacteria bacterium]|nr:hypothetical protein [Alphaproteobacteria bacterium]